MELSAAALPVLYSFRRCPYAMRARAALLSSGQRCALREVLLRDKPAALLAVSPKGTVPVLVLHDGAVIDQSLDVMRWALQRHDPAGWLQPERCRPEDMLALVVACDTAFKPMLDRYKYPGRFAGAPDAVAASDARAAGADWLHTLDARLRQALHLCGDRASLADAAIAPFVRQFCGVDAGWFAAQPWPHLQAWLAAWAGSPAFDRLMHRYSPWSGGPDTAWFPPPG